MAIDLIVQHVHSQLEEVRAAQSLGGEGASQPGREVCSGCPGGNGLASPVLQVWEFL